ncbi:MAG: TIGR02680 family protein, partial [Acidobacteriota bacterium]
MTSASENGLPKPRRARWQPLRSGLINLFRYDNEELWFEDGRLLLRGYNGTGKSRVLALQLPFLLDGEVSPHRLEPDGDPAKRIEWNLLMGKYDERRGYTWLELGRLTDDADEEGPGHERYLTLGCGLHAVKGRGLANRWFFLTERRVGVDLFLLGRAQEVLTRPHLAEALGEAGEIFTTARDYRAAVDRRLFQLGLQRYEALVDLLIQLRQPQLSRKLDAGKLSAALSEALPPLDRDILADIAEAFRSLEADRETLETLRSAAGGAEAFLRGYRRYAQIGARRRAEGVRTSHSAYEHARRRLRAAAERQQVATAGLDDADAELEQLQDAETRATAEVRTLERRPEMRDKQTLDAARQRAQDHLRAARRAGEELERATEQRGHARRQAEDERHAADQRHHEAERALVTTATASKAAGCATEHHQQLDDLGPAQIVATSLAATEQSLDELAGRKQRGVRHVRALQQQVATVEQRLTAAKELHTARAAELDEATERHQDAHRAVGAAQDRLLADYRQWRTEAIELAPPSAGELVEALTLWRREAEGPAPLSAAVRAAELTATRALETARAGQQIQQRRIEQELGELSTERAALQAGAHRPPAAPLHRAEGVREGRRGGPLWQLCDFAANITEIERAGLEAALEASGLLDAWITPEGDMLAAEDLDTVLVAGRSNPPSSGSALDALLLPDPTVVETSTVAADTVTKVLQHIGLGSGTSELWVQTDGRFQAGPLHGRADKPAAQHIGQSAREAERQRRLAEVEAAIAQTREQADAVAAALAELARRRDRVREEVARAPTEDPLRRAAADLAAATTFVDRARQLLVAAEAEVQRRRSELQGVIEERDAAARDLGIADHLDDLPGLEQSLAEYRRLLAALWPSLRALRSALAAAEAADERFQAAAREEARRNRASDEALDRQRASAAECETLEQTLGSGVREILERLEQARSRYAKIREQQQLTR